MRARHLRLLLILPILSIIVYTIDYLIFQDQNDIGNWILNSLGFVFIEVLLVTIFLHDVLERRERSERLSKLSNLLGLFFTESGLTLLDKFLAMDNTVKRDTRFVVTPEWTIQDYDEAISLVRNLNMSIKASPEDLEGIRTELVDKRDFLVRMMENPNLFEHERFTDLMLAILHLDEELKHRKDLWALPPSDLAHLSNDSLRVFQLLIVEWLEHMKHLKVNYPYLSSLAVRINPLNPKSDPVVKI
jgi:hypothetical protein